MCNNRAMKLKTQTCLREEVHLPISSPPSFPPHHSLPPYLALFSSSINASYALFTSLNLSLAPSSLHTSGCHRRTSLR